MAERREVGPDEVVQKFRVGVDFSVSAREMSEALELIDEVLTDARNGEGWVPGDTLPEGDQVLGLIDWERSTPRVLLAALVEDRYPGLVNDLSLVEVTRLLLRNHDSDKLAGLSSQMWDRLRRLVDEVNPLVRVDDPERPPGNRLLFDGDAADAAVRLTEGVYRAWDYDDREHVLVVAPSELAPSGRASAAFPKDRNDAQALDRISQLLQEHDRTKPLTELVRLISQQMNTTGRPALRSWIPIENEEKPAPLAGRMHVGVISWTDDLAVEPTIFADTNPVRLARKLATVLHEGLSDPVGFAGAPEFLDSHPAPAQWRIPEEVDAWLDALRNWAPLPAFSIQQVDILSTPPAAMAPTTEQEAARTALAAPSDRKEPQRFDLTVKFEVSARSVEEARRLVDESLTGDPASVTGGAQQRGRSLPDGDMWGVLGWVHLQQASGTELIEGVADAIAGFLRERAQAIDPASEARPRHSATSFAPGIDR